METQASIPSNQTSAIPTSPTHQIIGLILLATLKTLSELEVLEVQVVSQETSSVPTAVYLVQMVTWWVVMASQEQEEYSIHLWVVVWVMISFHNSQEQAEEDVVEEASVADKETLEEEEWDKVLCMAEIARLKVDEICVWKIFCQFINQKKTNI